MLNFEMLPAHFSFTYFYVTDEITLFAIFYQCFIGKELSEFYFRCISTVIQKSAFFIEQYGVFSGGWVAVYVPLASQKPFLCGHIIDPILVTWKKVIFAIPT